MMTIPNGSLITIHFERYSMMIGTIGNATGLQSKLYSQMTGTHGKLEK
jgi:hypothetical protein